MAKLKISCKTCDTGTLTKRKRYRMSGIVVLIGYLILIPSLLGVAFGVLSLGAGAAASVSSSSDVKSYELSEATRTSLRAAGVSDALVLQLEEGQPVPLTEMETLSDEQGVVVQQAASEVELRKTSEAAAAGILGLGVMFFIVVSLISGLLGWLLVMKKKVLQCGSCGSVVAAS